MACACFLIYGKVLQAYLSIKIPKTATIALVLYSLLNCGMADGLINLLPLYNVIDYFYYHLLEVTSYYHIKLTK